LAVKNPEECRSRYEKGNIYLTQAHLLNLICRPKKLDDFQVPAEQLRRVDNHRSLVLAMMCFATLEPCTNIGENVIGRTILAASCRRAEYRRVLSCLLLFLVTCGATAGAAHSHGSVTLNSSGSAAINDAGESNSDTGHSQQRECELCQFQQHLFNGIVHAPLFIVTPSTQTAFVSTLPVPYFSSAVTRSSGRAPPLG
jgi:Protein of unknown function (DUF2946)